MRLSNVDLLSDLWATLVRVSNANRRGLYDIRGSRMGEGYSGERATGRHQFTMSVVIQLISGTSGEHPPFTPTTRALRKNVVRQSRI